MSLIQNSRFSGHVLEVETIFYCPCALNFVCHVYLHYDFSPTVLNLKDYFRYIIW